MKLKYKLLLQFLLVAVLLLLVYSVVWIVITRNQIISASSQEVTSTADKANVLIDNFFAVKFAELHVTDPVNSAQLQSLLQQDKDITSVAILSRDGKEQTQVSSDDSVDNSAAQDLSNTAGF